MISVVMPLLSLVMLVVCVCFTLGLWKWRAPLKWLGETQVEMKNFHHSEVLEIPGTTRGYREISEHVKRLWQTAAGTSALTEVQRDGQSFSVCVESDDLKQTPKGASAVWA
jgi:hypothetical protein